MRLLQKLCFGAAAVLGLLSLGVWYLTEKAINEAQANASWGTNIQIRVDNSVSLVSEHAYLSRVIVRLHTLTAKVEKQDAVAKKKTPQIIVVVGYNSAFEVVTVELQSLQMPDHHTGFAVSAKSPETAAEIVFGQLGELLDDLNDHQSQSLVTI